VGSVRVSEASSARVGQNSYSLFRHCQLVYGLTGAYFLVAGLRFHHFGPNPYEAKAYYFYVSINALFLLAILLTGYWLILIRRRGVVLSNYVFSMEILFFVLSSWVPLYFAYV